MTFEYFKILRVQQECGARTKLLTAGQLSDTFSWLNTGDIIIRYHFYIYTYTFKKLDDFLFICALLRALFSEYAHAQGLI